MSMQQVPDSAAGAGQKFRVVIVGGGFGGLYAAKALGDARCEALELTLVDKRNFHLFQPLLYQVASGALSAGDIASPLRTILRKYKNISILMDEVLGIDPQNKTVQLRDEQLPYDALVIAAGGIHQYFGNDQWQPEAPSLKTLEDALEIRRRVFSAFEAAEREKDPIKRKAWQTFVIVGGGPTGVELAGTLSELAHVTLQDQFNRCRMEDTRIILLEAAPKILSVYSTDLIDHAVLQLEKLGVTVYTGAMVKDIRPGEVCIERHGQAEVIEAGTTLWTAGVKSSPLGMMISEKTGASLDRGGRLIVNADFSLPGHPEIFVVGDLAHYAHHSKQPEQDKTPLPGLASVAMQEGRYVGRLIAARLKNQRSEPFRYVDKGTLAIIGNNAAVGDLGAFRLKGFSAWFVWLFIHIFYLIGFENKILVLFQWLWNYFTRGRSACLITRYPEPRQ
ncbi:MAG: NAD(P)/FAD-dependent oxidoreductase [Vampirovibrionales bacterium]|nr:NAD(P)/FAD-dependent oxidoreductase [Vampirovibrionales bacterium]